MKRVRLLPFKVKFGALKQLLEKDRPVNFDLKFGNLCKEVKYHWLLTSIWNQERSVEKNLICSKKHSFLNGDWASFFMLPVDTYICFVRSLAIESFKCNCAYKFLAVLQLSFQVNFRSYVVLAHQILPCIMSVKDPEPIYWDNRNKTNQKRFHSNMKHFY